MASIYTFQFHSLYRLQPSFSSRKRQIPSNLIVFRTEFAPRFDNLSWNRLEIDRRFVSRATGDSSNSNENQTTQDESVTVQNDFARDLKNPVSNFRSEVSSLPNFVFVMKRHTANNILIGLCAATAILIVAVRMYIGRKSRQSRPGSVADLVRRGWLRSDRRCISQPLKYEDPFNNPFVKVGKSSSTIEMCGKVYRLAPVTLMKEEQSIHQKRRSRAYQWKRPKVFLKGDSIPPDVDPDTVRWIPANHPFATTANEIDKDLSQNNVYQKHGVPFRIKAEHEAMQRKLKHYKYALKKRNLLSVLQEEKFNNIVVDGRNATDFQRPFKFSPKSDELDEQGSMENHCSNSRPSKQYPSRKFSGSNAAPEETQNS